MTNLHLGALPKQKLDTEAGSQFPMQLGPFIYPGVPETAAEESQTQHGIYRRLMAACSHARHPRTQIGTRYILQYPKRLLKICANQMYDVSLFPQCVGCQVTFILTGLY